MEELRKQIIGIIDMDGFLIYKKILCKELGILKAGDVSAKSNSLTLVCVCQILMKRVEEILCA